MSQLTNMSITSVAFVYRGANRKKFFLTKSAGNHNQHQRSRARTTITGERKGDAEMNKVIKTALQTLMKSDEHKESTTDQLLTALKADKVVEKLKLTDEDFSEVKQDIEFFKSLAPAAPAAAATGDPEPTPDINKSDKQIIADLQKSVGVLTKTLEGQTKNLRLIDIRKHLTEKAPFAAIDIKKEAELIFELEGANPEAAKKMLEHFERTSTILERSGMLEELGSSLPGNDSLAPGSELLSEITASREELRKSKDGLTPQGELDAIVNLVKSKGADYYNKYVSDHYHNVRSGGRRMHAVD